MKKKIRKFAREFWEDYKDPIIAYSALITAIILLISPFAFGGASIALSFGANHVPCLITLGISFLGTALFCIAGIYLLSLQAFNKLVLKAQSKKIKNPEKKVKILLFFPIFGEAIYLVGLLKSAIEICFEGAYEAAAFFFFAFFVLSFIFFIFGITDGWE